MLRAPLDAAFKHGLERLVGGVQRFEGEVVAEQDEALAFGLTEMRKAVGQGADIFAMDLDEL